MINAIYPGSFDPITYGHIDIIKRCENLFSKLIIAIAHNVEKNVLFTVEERINMIEHSLQGFKNNWTVTSFEGLLVDFARKANAKVVIRGLRVISDFEYEFQMGLMNKKLYPEMETIFLMAKDKYSFVSSKLVKEICLLGGDVSEFVPPYVKQKLEEKFSKIR